MIKFIKFFRGYLYVQISGLSTERFLNLCSRMNIVLWNLTPAEDGYRLYISRKAFGMIEPALAKTGTQVAVIQKNGLPFLLKKYRRHSFFFFGILLAAILLYSMSLFIWKVEIEGNSYYSAQVILRYLEENGIGYASFKTKINCKEVQTMLRKEFEDITWVSAKIEGTKLYLVIQERMKGSGETSSETLYAEDENDTQSGETADNGADTNENNGAEYESGTDLIASDDGIIESIIVRSGTPLVKAGDEVEKGDTLVTGVIEIMSDYGETAAYHFVDCDADVEVCTALSYQDSFSVHYEETELTGENTLGFSFIFGSGILCLGSPSSKNDYLELTRLYPVVIGSDFYLPFQISKTRYLGYIYEQKTYTEEEIENLAQERLDIYCENLAENGVQILGNSVIIEQIGENVLVSGDLEALVTQSEYQKIIVEEMEEELSNVADSADDGDPG